MNLLVCSFNNYYNRIVKKLDTVDAYRAATTPLFIDLTDVNFNPADGVTTKHVVGKGTGMFLNWEQEGPNYCVVYEKVNNVETIKSRWFILDENRTRGGQYELSLRRDVLADYDISESPIYVEKGMIKDVESPLLCNNESLTVNQIKTKEMLLKDKSLSPWLVLYIKKGILGTTTAGQQGVITIDVPNEEFIYETLSTPITNWSLYQYVTNDYPVIDVNNIDVRFYIQQTTGSEYFYKLTKSGNSNVDWRFANPQTNLSVPLETWNSWGQSTFKTNMDNVFKSRYRSISNLIVSGLNGKSYQDLYRYNDMIIKDSLGKYYKVNVFNTGNTTQTTESVVYNSAKVALNNAWNTVLSLSQSGNDYAYKAQVTTTNYRISLTELTDIEVSLNFSRYQGNGTVDANYDIVCMPYGTVTEFIGWEVSQEITTDKERSLKIMNSIATQLGSEYVLDLQVLPYCPIQALLNDYYDEEGKIAILEDYIDEVVLYAYNQQGATDIVLVCPSANFTFDIETPVTIDSDLQDTYKIKYVNDCTLLRLCSPNYNGLFEMNLAKNGMSIDRFNVDITLRPANPYIHVNPNFKFLYGEDFNDVRGLVCGGDFSLGFINDAWIQYEIQNRNYQAIFDRQIQNLDVNNSIARQEAMFGNVAGAIQGTITGAGAGYMASGSPYGAMAGAVVGLGASGFGASLDMANLNKRQRETKDYAIDNFNLHLGNVRALPNSITKTSALTYNNKLFPFVEIYECSEEEKEAYVNKITYDGMTVGKIDKMSNYDSGFFKGQLIRNESLMIDNHIMNEINNELMKGVYI